MVPKNRNVENAIGTIKNIIPLGFIPLEISAIFPKEIIFVCYVFGPSQSKVLAKFI